MNEWRQVETVMDNKPEALDVSRWFPPPLQLQTQLDSIEEMRALLKFRRQGWSSLTAREAQLCQQVLMRLTGGIVS